MFPYDSDDSAKPAAHTPGPWALYDGFRRERGCVSVYDAAGVQGRWLANVHGDHIGPRDEAEIQANARLIAAAPALLAALRGLDAVLNKPSVPMHGDAVQAAIEAARVAIKLAAEGR